MDTENTECSAPNREQTFLISRQSVPGSFRAASWNRRRFPIRVSFPRSTERRIEQEERSVKTMQPGERDRRDGGASGNKRWKEDNAGEEGLGRKPRDELYQGKRANNRGWEGGRRSDETSRFQSPAPKTRPLPARGFRSSRELRARFWPAGSLSSRRDRDRAGRKGFERVIAVDRRRSRGNREAYPTTTNATEAAGNRKKKRNGRK